VSSLAALLVLRTVAALGRVEPLDGDDVRLSAVDLAVVETHWSETGLRARPWAPSKRVATLARGTRLLVRGSVASRDSGGCKGKDWYAVHPFGFVCSEHVRRAKAPPATGKALPLTAGRRLPYDYAIVRTEGAAMFASPEAAAGGVVTRSLAQGMNLAIARTVDVGGVAYIETVDGMLVAKHDVGWLGQGSEFAGALIAPADPAAPPTGPAFAWTLRERTAVLAEPDPKAAQVGSLGLRVKVPLLEESGEADPARWWKIGEGKWVPASQLAEVVFIDPPDGVLRDTRVRDQWIDVDLGEQVLVAYRDRTPVYATMVSSGKGSPTPRGNYPIWAKVASMTMANQDYEDKPYMVEHVPWVLLFQGHNALHGAYWHDRFGNRKSHGCVNLAPRDARWLFEWALPALPHGWTGYLPSDLDRSVVVHLRDSSLPPAEQFLQERPIGPPDPEEEKKKLELAEQRRAEAAAAVPAGVAGG
jgi:lipoprotein-anchoring transpeptidase ErfK/SrfK